MISTERSPTTGIFLTLPNCDDSEVVVLDAAVNDPDWRPKILERIRAHHFLNQNRREVYSTTRLLVQQGYDPDLIAVRDELDRQGRLDDAIDLMAILREMEGLPNRLNVEYHIGRVQKAYRRRALMQAGEILTRKAGDLGASIDDLRELLESTTRITSDDGDSGFMGAAAEDLESFADVSPDWLVEHVLTTDEPTIFAAGSKCNKSCQLLELAVSLTTGESYMGFNVPKLRRVLYIAGEANQRLISRQLKKALTARGLAFSDLCGRLHVETTKFPQLISPDDMRSLTRTIKAGRFDVVIYDPLYRGIGGLDSNRLDEAGPAVKGLQAACHPAALIVSHHIVKFAARDLGQPPRLEDITGGFAAQTFGQWWLVCRNEKYQFDGFHDLTVTYGGREGQAGGVSSSMKTPGHGRWKACRTTSWHRSNSEPSNHATPRRRKKRVRTTSPETASSRRCVPAIRQCRNRLSSLRQGFLNLGSVESSRRCNGAEKLSHQRTLMISIEPETVGFCGEMSVDSLSVLLSWLGWLLWWWFPL